MLSVLWKHSHANFIWSAATINTFLFLWWGGCLASNCLMVSTTQGSTSWLGMTSHCLLVWSGHLSLERWPIIVLSLMLWRIWRGTKDIIKPRMFGGSRLWRGSRGILVSPTLCDFLGDGGEVFFCCDENFVV